MEVDEDDDFYGDGDTSAPAADATTEPTIAAQPQLHDQRMQGNDLEDGEEEEDEGEDEDDSDIEIVTERKDGTKAAPPSKNKYNEIRNIPQRTTSNDTVTKQVPIKRETATSPKAPTTQSTAQLPAYATSKIDIDAKPIYPPAGKPITQVDIDADLPDNDKPWRRPGTDISDFFNYGFDEFTWALYSAKQDGLRDEYDADKMAANQKKMMEDMSMMMGMGGMPGMGRGAGAGVMPGMEGMAGMPAEMQQMMQQMMASGMDPSQMDPSAMFGAQGGQVGQGFAAPQGFDQGQGYGNIGAGNAHRGNFRGRGRGRW